MRPCGVPERSLIFAAGADNSLRSNNRHLISRKDEAAFGAVDGSTEHPVHVLSPLRAM
jgi:hypothetical protein